jgi:hypothetical protein
MLRSRCCSFAIAAALGALGVLGSGCKDGPAESPADFKARAVAAVDARLRGAWVLQTFKPETQLEPILVPMLEFQFGQLVVKLDGQHLVADSPGLHVERTYRILDAQGDQFELVLFDEQGVSYPGTALFVDDNDIRFRSNTTRWKGEGMLRRTAMPTTTTVIQTTTW